MLAANTRPVTITESSNFGQISLISGKVPLSRDEMNLAEFPLTVLSTRVDPKVKTLEFKDSIRKKSGEVIERNWIVTAADKFGLPTSSDDEVLLGLLKLTVHSNFQSSKVYFTRYELLKALKWTTEGRSYRRLQHALDRLSGVRIKATNAFYDNSSKSHSTCNFGIIDAYEINDGAKNADKPSFFTWSDVLFKSFQVGFIKKLDLEFYLNLKSAVSKRLYRYLDKHFWYSQRLQTSVFTLAHEKLGISRNYQYVSAIRQQLDPAFEELLAVKFLSKVEYSGRGQNTEVLIYAQGKQVKGPVKSSSAENNEERTELTPQPLPFQSAVPTAAIHTRIEQSLIERGIGDRQALKLVSGRNSQELQRMEKIIAHFDFLLRSNSKLISRSPVGFLYKAVEYPERFYLPEDKKPQQAKPKHTSKSTNSEGADEELRGQYLVDRKMEIARIKTNIEPGLIEKIENEVKAALTKVRGLISERNFDEAIKVGVEEKLIKLFAFPEFEAWKRRKTDT